MIGRKISWKREFHIPWLFYCYDKLLFFFYFRKRYIFVFESVNGPGPLAPLFVDISGVYFRPEGLGNTYICGCSPNEVNEREND
jgi:hypothetical protein